MSDDEYVLSDEPGGSGSTKPLKIEDPLNLERASFVSLPNGELVLRLGSSDIRTIIKTRYYSSKGPQDYQSSLLLGSFNRPYWNYPYGLGRKYDPHGVSELVEDRPYFSKALTPPEFELEDGEKVRLSWCEDGLIMLEMEVDGDIVGSVVYKKVSIPGYDEDSPGWEDEVFIYSQYQEKGFEEKLLFKGDEVLLEIAHEREELFLRRVVSQDNYKPVNLIGQRSGYAMRFASKDVFAYILFVMPCP